MRKWIIILGIMLGIMLILFTGCEPKQPQINETNETNDTEPLLPRVRGADYEYCIGMGYKYESRIENGTHEEFCTFPDGNECIAFDFMLFECGRKYSLCSIKGYSPKIGIEQHETFNATYAICLFPDNSYCKELDFYNRDCHIKW